METFSIEKVNEAFAADCCGGRLKPICNRRIEGYKCRCYVRYVIVDDIQYWRIFYLINQRPVSDPDFRPLVRKMFRIVHTAVSLLESSGTHVVIVQNEMPG